MQTETIGGTRHVVRFQNPGPPVPDADGGFITSWAPTDPPVWAMSIRPASTRDLESVASGTVVAQATHILIGRWHPAVTIETRVLFRDRIRDRILEVADVSIIDERGIEMQLFCKESVQTAAPAAAAGQPAPGTSQAPAIEW